MCRHACFRSLGCILAGLALTCVASAQNILLNPGFAHDLSGWDPFTGFGVQQEWSTLDAAGDPGSGSILGTLPASSTFRIPIYASQCISIQPSTTYAFRGNVLLPSATTPATAYGTLFANSYAAANCAGNPVNTATAPTVTALDAWTGTGAAITTGASDLTVRVHLRVFAPAGTTLRSYFDDVVFERDGLFADGFD
jgi:hypothetical protein